MPMTRQERIGLHTNQKRIQASKSIPSIKEITEGKPIFRETHKGLYQYVKFRGEVYSTLLTKHTRSLEEEINDTVNNITINNLTVTDPIDVADGGTGLTTITDGAVMLGSGTSAITPLAVTTNGSILIGDGSTDPTTYDAFSSSTGTLKVSAGGTGVTSITNLKNLLDDETWTFAQTVSTTGDLSVGDDLTVGDEVSLTTDASVFRMGIGGDFTITHDGSTGATLAATPITVNSTGDMTLDSTTDIILDAAGLQIYMDGSGSGNRKFTFNLDSTPEIDVSGAFTLDGSSTITLDSVSNFIVNTNGREVFKMGTSSDAFFHNFEGTFTGGIALFQNYRINNLADKYHFVTAFHDYKQNYALVAEDIESSAYNTSYGS